MTDNRIRCALVYRLQSNAPVTVLAKYDHASDYETHGGAATGALYGGRDKSYADAVGTIIGNDPPGPASDTDVLGGFKVVQSDVHQVVYGADSEGLCIAVITGQKYPSRTAIQMLTEIYSQFAPKFSLQVKSATANSLSKKAKSMLSSTCEKYDDLSKVDKASSLIAKVEGVKSQMSDNIAGMLDNTDKADSIAEQSKQLSDQANVFKKKSTDLKKQMKCKNMKMTIILVLVVVGILAIILIPMILNAKAAKEARDQANDAN